MDDLANAKNIRHLKPDDSVTVVVLGSGAGGALRRWEGHTPAGKRKAIMSAGGNGEEAAASDAGSQSTMTLRARKSDIDAFAKGKLSAEEFRKNVSVQVY
jgi:hypothetical protein